jgi:Xaa-Pro aminopeptidase
MSAYADRISRVQERLRDERIAVAVFAPTDQMRYLTGWAEYGHERLIALFVPANGDPVFVVPSMNAPQARRNAAGIPDVRGWDDASGWHSVVSDLLRGWDASGRGIAIDDELYSGHLLAIQDLVPDARYRPAGDLMARLREIKTADEIEKMRRSGALTDSVYGEALSALREGITELELQEAIADAYKRRGTRPAFAIVCFGANTALPHHSTGQARLQRGDMVIMDIGCLLEGYASDITRTVSFGRPTAEQAGVYDVVYRAHMAAFEAGRPGVACEDVDRAARDVIDEAGYGEYFIHRTGHGIGLSTHEPPYIVQGNKQELRLGMCFSDEPGIYLPDRFGVRIENIVTVTDGGLRSLNADPPSELLIVEEAR